MYAILLTQSYSKDSPTLSLKDAAVQFDYRVPVEGTCIISMLTK